MDPLGPPGNSGQTSRTRSQRLMTKSKRSPANSSRCLDCRPPRSMPRARRTRTALGCSGLGMMPALTACTASVDRCSARASAICERALLPVHRNSTRATARARAARLGAPGDRPKAGCSAGRRSTAVAAARQVEDVVGVAAVGQRCGASRPARRRAADAGGRRPGLRRRRERAQLAHAPIAARRLAQQPPAQRVPGQPQEAGRGTVLAARSQGREDTSRAIDVSGAPPGRCLYCYNRYMSITTSAARAVVDPVTRARPRLVLAICCMSLLMVGMDVTIVNVALPSVRRDLGASVSELQWTTAAYTVVLASLLMLGGSIADRLGRARVFKFGLALFTACVAGLQPRAGRRLAHRLSRPSGRRRRNAQPGRDVDHPQHVRGSARAGAGDRGSGCRRRHQHGPGADPRRRPRRAQLAGRIPGQHPHRAGRHRPHGALRPRVPRAAPRGAPIRSAKCSSSSPWRA